MVPELVVHGAGLHAGVLHDAHHVRTRAGRPGHGRVGESICKCNRSSEWSQLYRHTRMDGWMTGTTARLHHAAQVADALARRVPRTSSCMLPSLSPCHERWHAEHVSSDLPGVGHVHDAEPHAVHARLHHQHQAGAEHRPTRGESQRREVSNSACMVDRLDCQAGLRWSCLDLFLWCCGTGFHELPTLVGVRRPPGRRWTGSCCCSAMSASAPAPPIRTTQDSHQVIGIASVSEPRPVRE